jgi:hypothetical protein
LDWLRFEFVPFVILSSFREPLDSFWR